MVAWKSIVALALSASAAVVSAGNTISCSPDSPCPKDAPCCNAQGICGSTPDYCQGGCDTRASFALDSCAPMPQCRAGTYNFDKKTVDNLKYYQFYEGNSEKYPWTYTGEVLSQNGNAVLTMRKNSVGTVMFSTFYIFYGKISVKMKTSHRAGVVSDFILMSNVKDEIDYEFVGTQLETAQTNYYYEGILDWHNEKNGAVDSSTYDNFHTYTVDWTPESVSWIIDGTTVRTLNKADTLNTTTNFYHYPQTPARVQLAIWPGGASNQGEGTIEWAGGPIDWNAPDLTDPGYYYVEVESVEVECYDPPSDVKNDGDKTYIYTDKDPQENDVELSNEDSYSAASSLNTNIATSSEYLQVVSHVYQSSSVKSKASSSSMSLAVVSDVAPSSTSSSKATPKASSEAAASGSGSPSSSSAGASLAAASTSGSSPSSAAATASAESAAATSAAGAMALTAPVTGVLAMLVGLFL